MQVQQGTKQYNTEHQPKLKREPASGTTQTPCKYNLSTMADNSDARRQPAGTQIGTVCHSSSSWHKAPHRRPATARETTQQSGRLGVPEQGPRPNLSGAHKQSGHVTNRYATHACTAPAHTRPHSAKRTHSLRHALQQGANTHKKNDTNTGCDGAGAANGGRVQRGTTLPESSTPTQTAARQTSPEDQGTP